MRGEFGDHRRLVMQAISLLLIFSTVPSLSFVPSLHPQHLHLRDISPLYCKDGGGRRMPLQCRGPPVRRASMVGVSMQNGDGIDLEERAIGMSNQDSEEGMRINDMIARISSTTDANPPSKLGKALKKTSSAPAIIAELAIASKSAAKDAELLSMACRKGKAAAAWLDTSSPEGLEVLRIVVAEQATAKGKFPGPVPVVCREEVTHVSQIAVAASLGAVGVVLSADALDAEELKELISACYAAGIEAVVEASDRGALERAEEAGAKIVCVRGVSSVDEAAELFTLVPQGVISLACVPAMQEGEQEVAEGQSLLQVGYNGIVMMDAASEADDEGYVEWVLKAMTSKKSRTFDFGTTGTTDNDNKDSPLTLGAAQEAKKKNPTAWAKAKREAGLIMKDYRSGKRSLKTSKSSD